MRLSRKGHELDPKIIDEEEDFRRAVVEIIYRYCYGRLADGVADERISRVMEELDKIRSEP